MSLDARSSLSRCRRVELLLALTLVIVGLDQYSKVYAVRHWKGQPVQSFAGDTFRIEYAENRGAFLSLLSDTPEQVRFAVLTVINGLVLLGFGIYLLTARQMALFSFLALSLVVAGGIGNLIDRIRFGYVIDYFNLGWGSLRTGIFNVADMAITAGFLLLIPLALRGDPKPADATANDSPAPAATSSPSAPEPQQRSESA